MENVEFINPKLSFISEDITSFKTVKDLTELREKVAECRKTGKSFSKYNLTNLGDIKCVCFDGLTIEDVVFCRFCPTREKRPLLFQLSFVGAHLERVSFAHANLLQCNFDTREGTDDYEEKIATLNRVDFFYSELHYCRFRKTKSIFVDFRYSCVDNCTMGEFNVDLGDFYFCNFKGCTSFVDSHFENCSFTCATFENACIRMKNIAKGIVQENSEKYHSMFLYNDSVRWNRYNPCSSFSCMNHHFKDKDKTKSNAFIAGEAMNFYKQMSGIYAGKGLNRDSNKAYEKRVLEERKYCKYKMQELSAGVAEKDDHSWWYYWRCYIATWMTQSIGYGFKWVGPCIWFTILVILFWGIYQLTERLEVLNMPDSVQHLGFSLNNALGPFQEYYEVVNVLLSALQSTIGIILVGFLGFIMANKIRNNS